MLQGQVAVITGATEGIGRATAVRMAGQGANLVLAARTQAKLEALSQELERDWPGIRVMGAAADVTDSKQVNRLIDTALESFKKIDILVNNVGRGLRKPLAETTDAEWRTLVDQNLSGTFFTCRAVLPQMLRQKRGIIVNIASRTGRVGEAEMVAYCAVKHGVVGLTRALAAEAAGQGIRVNAICPGPVSTERMKGLRPELRPDEWLSPEDVAEAVLFLATSPGHTMNGRTVDMF